MLTVLAALTAALLAYIGYTIHTANFHTIVVGEAYRSGQMDAAQLARTIQAYGIIENRIIGRHILVAPV